ncbi:hypothetical protein Ndes2526B_g02787 [Nannochloris sp. 'desiccata']
MSSVGMPSTRGLAIRAPLPAAFRPSKMMLRRIAKCKVSPNATASPDVEQLPALEEMSEEKRDIQKMLSKPYKYGFKTIIESDVFPKGLSEDVVRAISAKKNEPDWMLDFRLKAYRKWLTMEEPDWSDNTYPTIDYQDLSYYSAPKAVEKKKLP